jgi:non-heme chloroperoxidase
MYPNDPKALAAAEAYDTKRTAAIADSFEQGVPTATVIRLKDADHYVFQSNEAEVIREMNAFVANLH